MKPVIKDLSIVEYYKTYINFRVEQIREKSTGEKSSEETNIFKDLTKYKYSFEMETASLALEILIEKSISCYYYDDVIELVDVVKKMFRRKKILNYADIEITRSGQYTHAFKIKVYDKKYLPFCEKIMKYLIDFGEVTMKYEGPRNINFNSLNFYFKRRSAKKFLYES